MKVISPQTILAGLLLLSMPLWAFLLTEHDLTLALIFLLQSILTLITMLIIIRHTVLNVEKFDTKTREPQEKHTSQDNDIIPTTVGFDVDATRDPSSEGWVDTGVYVEKGTFISFSITGEASCHTGEKTGPGGHNEATAFNDAIGTEFPSGALIAKIGDHPEIYMLDTSGTLSVDSPGIIFLAVNNPTGNYNKAEGGFTVNITLL